MGKFKKIKMRKTKKSKSKKYKKNRKYKKNTIKKQKGGTSKDIESELNSPKSTQSTNSLNFTQSTNSPKSTQSTNSLNSTNPSNSPNMNDEGEGLVLFPAKNDVCPNGYSEKKVNGKLLCHKTVSVSNIMSYDKPNNYNKNQPEEASVELNTPEMAELKPEIDYLKTQQEALLNIENEQKEIKSKNGELTEEDKLKQKELEENSKKIKTNMRSRMKQIIKEKGPATLRLMTAAGLTATISLLLFPAMGIAAPGVGSSVFKGINYSMKRTGNALTSRYNKRTRKKKEKGQNSTANQSNSSPPQKKNNSFLGRMRRNRRPLATTAAAAGVTAAAATTTDVGKTALDSASKFGQSTMNKINIPESGKTALDSASKFGQSAFDAISNAM